MKQHFAYMIITAASLLCASASAWATDNVADPEQVDEEEVVLPDSLRFPPSMVSGTLPLMVIDTEDHRPVEDKVTQIPATLNIYVPKGYNSMMRGDALESQTALTLSIRGRGNNTWLSAKKPYKLKFDSKEEPLGYPQHKHFSLIPFMGYLNYMSGTGGLEIARLTGMGWTPGTEPVEVVLNNTYMGRYFLVENIKVSKNRLNIFEQPDLCEDPELVPYGWLVELDNHPEEGEHITIEEYEGKNLDVTYHVPELLSEVQSAWLTEEFTKLNAAIYADDDDSGEEWARYIDAASAARYFIVREMMWDPDGYSGSMYLHRDKGENALWTFGPMWDVASVHREKDAWVHESSVHYDTRWFPRLLQTRAFRQALVREWNDFAGKLDELDAFFDRMMLYCSGSDNANWLRWTPWESSVSTLLATAAYKKLMRSNAAWIDAAVKEFDRELSVGHVADPGSAVMIDGNCVRVSPAVQRATAEVYSMAGELRATATLRGGETHSFGHLQSGIYLLRTRVDGNLSATSTKMIIR